MSGGAPPTSGIPQAPSSSSLSSGLPPPPPPPKILLAKPAGGAAAGQRLGREDDPSAVVHRSRNAQQPGSLNLLSESWEFHTERILPFLTENTDFTVIGIIGPPGVGKSTIMNELYGFDGSSPGMLPPFATQSDESRAMAKHCTVGIELRVSSERLILLDAQPIFSPSILVDMMKPDGSSAIPVLTGESLPADLAHELMGIQLGVFLASVCNVLMVVSEGIHDFSVWQLMLTVDLLKHGIPEPSLLNSALEKEVRGNLLATSEYLSAALVFVHSKLQNQDLSHLNGPLLRKALLQFFHSSSFRINKSGTSSLNSTAKDSVSEHPDVFLLPAREKNLQKPKPQFESYFSAVGKLRDQVLSMNGHPFGRNISEREWLRNSAKIWELIKKSPIISEYCRTLQGSGLFRK
ncbi:protein SMG9-like isoform X2 [Zingiber officinale]|uniref:protein SMG9-like isoform X2 n=1 Tax=Zingiber officinale TaxID=94328 RepID=UPI001C4BA78E|nr:protein SMG9-like isoform X2 [Zingiber officinale]